MPDEKRTLGGDLSPLLIAAGAGAIGAWYWWLNRPLPTSDVMAGRVCVVTGGNAGIGKATATALAQQGAHVVLACRCPTKGSAACGEIRRKVPGATVETLPLDLESVSSIRGFVKRFRETSLPLHVLVNNAAIVTADPETTRGMEKTMVVNHLGPFLLTNLLLPDLRKSASSPPTAGGDTTRDPSSASENVPGILPRASRIVNVSSRLEKRGTLLVTKNLALAPGPAWFQQAPGDHDTFSVYGSSKLYNLIFSFELDRRLSALTTTPSSGGGGAGGGRVTVNAVTPGIVNTSIGDCTMKNRWLRWAAPSLKALLMRRVEKGAETVVWAAASPDVEGVGGKFFGDLKEVPCSETSKDEVVGRRMWEASEIAAELDESERVL